MASLSILLMLFAMLSIRSARTVTRGMATDGTFVGVEGIQVAVPPEPKAQRVRETIALFVATTVAVLGVSVASLTDVSEQLVLGAVVAAGVLSLLVARQPVVDAQRSAQRIRKAVPGFVRFVEASLDANESPIAILRRYIAIESPTRRELQALVARALARSEDMRERPFQSLAVVSEEWRLKELSNIAKDLAQAERGEGNMIETLRSQGASLELTLEQEFKRELNRRNLMVIGASGLAVVSIVLSVLFYNVIGSGVIPL